MSYSNIVDQLHLKGGHLDMGRKRLLNVEYPSDKNDGVNKQYVDEKFAAPNTVNGKVLQPSFHWVAGEDVSQGNKLAIGPRYNTLNVIDSKTKISIIDSNPNWCGSTEYDQGGFTCTGPTLTNFNKFSISYNFVYIGNQGLWEGGHRYHILDGVGGEMNVISISYLNGDILLHLNMAGGGILYDTSPIDFPLDLNKDTRVVLTIVKNETNLKIYVNGILKEETDTLNGNEGINTNTSMKIQTMPNGSMLSSVTLFNEYSLNEEEVKELTHDFLKFRPSHLKGIKAGFYSS